MTLLDRAYPFTPMFRDAQKSSIPEHMGTTSEWRIYGGSTVATTGAGLALATTALTEGVPPAETAMTVAKVTKAVQQYGAYVKFSDLLVHQGIDNIWDEAFGALGEQAGQTLHTLLVNDLSGGTAVQYASTAVSRVTVTAAMIVNGAELREARRTLARAKVPRFPDGFWHALIHPDVVSDLMNDTDWKAMNTYQGGQALSGNSMIKGEVGSLHGFKFIESTDAPKFSGAGSGGADVYGTLLYGPGWYGTVDLDFQGTPTISPENQRGMRISGIPAGTQSHADPLGQYGIAGWITTYGGVILQDWRGLRLESGATA